MRNTFVSAALLSAVALVSARAIEKRDIIWESNQAAANQHGNLIFDNNAPAPTLAVVNRNVALDATSSKKTRSKASRTAYTAAPVPTGGAAPAPSAPAPAAPAPAPSSAAPAPYPSSAAPQPVPSSAAPQPYPSSAAPQPASSANPQPPAPPAANPTFSGTSGSGTLGAPGSTITWNAVKERQFEGADESLGGTDSSTTFDPSDAPSTGDSSSTIESRDVPWWKAPKPEPKASQASPPQPAKATGAAPAPPSQPEQPAPPAPPAPVTQPQQAVPKLDPIPGGEPGSITIDQTGGAITNNHPNGDSESISPAGSSITFWPSSGENPTTASTGGNSDTVHKRDQAAAKPKPKPKTIVTGSITGGTQTLGIGSSTTSFTPAFGGSSSSGSTSSTTTISSRDDIATGSSQDVDEVLSIAESNVIFYPANADKRGVEFVA